MRERPDKTHNVVGYVEGSDERLKEEYVLIGSRTLSLQLDTALLAVNDKHFQFWFDYVYEEIKHNDQFFFHSDHFPYIHNTGSLGSGCSAAPQKITIRLQIPRTGWITARWPRWPVSHTGPLWSSGICRKNCHWMHILRLRAGESAILFSSGAELLCLE